MTLTPCVDAGTAGKQHLEMTRARGQGGHV